MNLGLYLSSKRILIVSGCFRSAPDRGPAHAPTIHSVSSEPWVNTEELTSFYSCFPELRAVLLGDNHFILAFECATVHFNMWFLVFGLSGIFQQAPIFSNVPKVTKEALYMSVKSFPVQGAVNEFLLAKQNTVMKQLLCRLHHLWPFTLPLHGNMVSNEGFRWPPHSQREIEIVSWVFHGQIRAWTN